MLAQFNQNRDGLNGTWLKNKKFVEHKVLLIYVLNEENITVRVEKLLKRRDRAKSKQNDKIQKIKVLIIRVKVKLSYVYF